MESAQAGEQGSSGLHWGGGQPSSPIAHGLSILRVRQLGRVGGASGAPTGAPPGPCRAQSSGCPSGSGSSGGGPRPTLQAARGSAPPHRPPALSPHGAPQARGEGGGRHLTRPTLSVLLSSSGMGTYTARATQLAKMVSRMMVSKGLRPALRSEARGAGKRLLGVGVPRLPPS